LQSLSEETERERDKEHDREPLCELGHFHGPVVDRVPADVSGGNGKPTGERTDELETDRALEHREHEDRPVRRFGVLFARPQHRQNEHRVGDQLHDAERRAFAVAAPFADDRHDVDRTEQECDRKDPRPRQQRPVVVGREHADRKQRGREDANAAERALYRQGCAGTRKDGFSRHAPNAGLVPAHASPRHCDLIR
jgi:hypothetical protein